MTFTHHLTHYCALLQTLGKIYSILTDKDKRAVYDEDGTVDEEDSIFDQVVNCVVYVWLSPCCDDVIIYLLHHHYIIIW